ncbi:hypothetical protein B932_3352 [Gluconobacter oxydans H24]|uniref:JmjC domain-containing protein n=1 Tax=Gluconobacter thailandicus TaxID=257438 RepID=UPI000299731A|nr:cupin domain-containing protein [Gluconobacter thailandicus]AFW02897.1 hypothetical protein B932_3352 [Gluconobacter oxydans H24]
MNHIIEAQLQGKESVIARAISHVRREKRAAVFRGVGVPISLGRIERILVANNLKYPFFRVFINGHNVPRENCVTSTRCGSSTEYDIANLEHIYRCLHNGGTVELLDVGRSDQIIDQLCANIGRLTDVTPVCHAYFSYRQSHSFGRHADPHDVMAIQIAGRKKWQFDADIEVSEFDATGQSGVCSEQSVSLSTGDVLVVSRGVHHDTQTEGHGSCHISFSIPAKSSVQERVAVARAVRSLRSQNLTRLRIDRRLFAKNHCDQEAKRFYDLCDAFDIELSKQYAKQDSSHLENKNSLLDILHRR